MEALCAEAVSHAQTLGADVKVAVEAALAGGAALRTGWKGTETVSEKGLGDLVSSVDVAAETAVLAVLRAARPGDLILRCEKARRRES